MYAPPQNFPNYYSFPEDPATFSTLAAAAGNSQPPQRHPTVSSRSRLISIEIRRYLSAKNLLILYAEAG